MLSRAWATSFLSLRFSSSSRQALRVPDLQPVKLLLPVVLRGLADTVTAAKVLDVGFGLRFLQHGNDLFIGTSGSLHGLDRHAPFGANPEPRSGLFPGESSSP